MPVVPVVGGLIDRVVATAQNGLEVIRFGGLDTGSEPAPYQVVDTEPMYRLRRYFPDDPAIGPAVILVHPMMVSANVYDVSPNSAVTLLRRGGVDPWVVDFGSPDKETGGMERTLADHIVAIDEIVDRVREYTGRDGVHLAGYSQGGMFCYQAAAYRRSKNIESVIAFGSPVDFNAGAPLGLPTNVVMPAAQFLAENVFNRLALPSWMARTGFQLVDPVKTAKSRLDFLRQLHDRDALMRREDQRRFLENDGWVAWSGPAIAELLNQFVANNRMVSGGFVINGQLVSLSDITCPILAFVGTADEIGQPASVRGILAAASSAAVYERTLPAGHFGLVVGSLSGRVTWPTVAGWIHWRAGDGELPDDVVSMAEVDPSEGPGISVRSILAGGLGAAIDVGAVAGREALDVADGLRRTSQAVLRESVRTLPRLVRLGQIQPGTRVSLGKIMNENARRGGDAELFLFQDRVLSHRAVNDRIDNVVRGLIACGVRPGQHIGVLMQTRPSALVVVAALSRLGAVAVILREDGDTAAELRLGETATVIVDPPNLAAVTPHADRALVLGGGDERTIAEADGARIVDMEQIDPAEVSLPGWYRPDPGLAGDLAYVLFTRSGGTVEKWPITNHRWALSAFSAASSANLSRADTVLCLTPLHHASGLLTTLGATVVGGARIALSDGLDPPTFASEVRRYGITVVSYTWSMLTDIVEDERGLPEQNTIRLFFGSGMPAGLWERVEERFPQARVLEFFATADGSAILGNVTSTKIGAVGKPLPATNAVRLAAYDLDGDRLVTGATGYVREASADEPGLLLTQASQRNETGSLVLRDVFGRRDRWEVADHLFRRDYEGDYWLLGHVNSVAYSADGAVFPQPIVDALSRMPQVRHAVCYPLGTRGAQLSVAAVSHTGSPPDGSALRLALAQLPPSQRPHLICVVDDIPLSSTWRPRADALRRRGLPKPGPGVWYRDAEGRYKRLTRAARTELFE